MKTKFTKFWLLALTAVLVTGCATDNEPATTSQPESYDVSEEAALSHLRSMLDGFSKTRTSAYSFDAEDVQTLRTGAVQQTRSEADEALAYIVNFDEGGYAILGADRRLAPVIAVVEQGTMSPETLAAAKEKMDAGEELDLATYIDATVVGNMIRTLNDPTIAPSTIVDIELVESAGPLMRTCWGPQDINAPSSTIALAQMLLYNAKYKEHYPSLIYNHGVNWNLILEAATTPHLGDGAGYNRTSLNDLTKAITAGIEARLGGSGDTQIERVIGLMKRTESYYELYSYEYFYHSIGFNLARDMILNKNLPVFMNKQETETNSFSWVIDGWLKYKYTNVAPGEGVQGASYVFVNFGMGGTHNGYYQLPNIVSPGVGYNTPTCFEYSLKGTW